jgi:hypothetical protein
MARFPTCQAGVSAVAAASRIGWLAAAAAWRVLLRHWLRRSKQAMQACAATARCCFSFVHVCRPLAYYSRAFKWLLF